MDDITSEVGYWQQRRYLILQKSFFLLLIADELQLLHRIDFFCILHYLSAIVLKCLIVCNMKQMSVSCKAGRTAGTFLAEVSNCILLPIFNPGRNTEILSKQSVQHPRTVGTFLAE
jgi:hypothetical protein